MAIATQSHKDTRYARSFARRAPRTGSSVAAIVIRPPPDAPR